MEIPDVIAVNKMDQPGREDDAERGALDPRARSRPRLAAADRAHRGDARRERRRAVGRDRARTARTSSETAGSRSGGGATSPGGVRRRVGAREGAPRAGGAPTIAELRRLLDAVQRRELDPLTRRARDPRQGLPHRRRRRRSLTSRRRARGSTASRASRRSTAPRRSRGWAAATCSSRPRTSSAPARSRSAARSTRSRSLERARARGRRRRGQRRQPRPGGRLGGARRPGSRATIFVPEDAPMAKVDATRSYGADVELAGRGFEEAVGRGRRTSRETARRSSTRSRTARSSPGQGTIGLELAEQVPGAEHRAHPDRRRRARVGHRDRAAGGAAGRAHRRRAGGGDAPEGTRSRTGSR